MFLKSRLLLSSALIVFLSVPSYATEQRVNIDNNSVHIQNGGQELHIDLGNDKVQIHQNADVEEDSDYSVSSPSSGSNFTNAEISNQSFMGQDLKGVSFTNATLNKISFRNANLQNADFTNAELVDCDFRGANVVGANFTNATFEGSLIKGVDFSKSNLTNADMSGANQTSFVPTSSDSIARSLTQPTEKGKPAFVNLSITFDFDKADVSHEGLEQIQELAKALQSPLLSSSVLMIEGHTDSMGSDDYNMSLSDRRAHAIVTALENIHHISSNRLQSHGYGEMRPVAGNDSDFGRAQNRRVTIVNISK